MHGQLNWNHGLINRYFQYTFKLLVMALVVYFRWVVRNDVLFQKYKKFSLECLPKLYFALKQSLIWNDWTNSTYLANHCGKKRHARSKWHEISPNIFFFPSLFHLKFKYVWKEGEIYFYRPAFSNFRTRGNMSILPNLLNFIEYQ